jgi:uncharacterized protein (DUF1697 family)
MSLQIALFRGLNVGKAHRIAMTDLKRIFEGLGFGEVLTLLNSGNVVFEAGRTAPAANAKRIAVALAERAGITTHVLVLTAKTLNAAIAANPYADEVDDSSRLLVGFYIDVDSCDRDLAPFESLRREHPREAFAIGTDACYLWCRGGILESRIGDALAGARFRARVTTRNWATALKLQAMARE